jgi:redox-sensitive bicupin YhaK (pirin superfamily)
MSWTPAPGPDQQAHVIEPRARDLGGFSVRRVLPAPMHRTVGPFIFFDEMGPADFAPGHGMDVRPHPHINLATVTYLFEGEIFHRDSLGTAQSIHPGAINWMTAGQGITHSERTPPEVRAAGGLTHGLQLWVALPVESEEVAPSFHHYPAELLPRVERPGLRARVLVGSALGVTSPVATHSPIIYIDAELEAGAELELPAAAELAVYAIDEPRRMVLLEPGQRSLRADSATRLVVIGGEPVGPRFIEWNFVSSSRERIEQAKRDWRERRFPLVPGDEQEFIPLPD